MSGIEEFLAALRAGEFKLPVCISCGTTMWPPSARCAKCYSPTALKTPELVGTLIEFSNSYVKNREGTFGVIDMNGIRIVGSLSGSDSQVGTKVRMVACGLSSDGSPYYEFQPTGT